VEITGEKPVRVVPPIDTRIRDIYCRYGKGNCYRVDHDRTRRQYDGLDDDASRGKHCDGDLKAIVDANQWIPASVKNKLPKSKDRHGILFCVDHADSIGSELLLASASENGNAFWVPTTTHCRMKHCGRRSQPMFHPISCNLNKSSCSGK
jgi:hypothetical protein